MILLDKRYYHEIIANIYNKSISDTCCLWCCCVGFNDVFRRFILFFNLGDNNSICFNSRVCWLAADKMVEKVFERRLIRFFIHPKEESTRHFHSGYFGCHR